MSGAGRTALADLDELLRTRSVVICCGSGGVGKTTTSAALALRAAAIGRRAVVCTIDPARRLANSLGLSELGNEEVEVPGERFEEAGWERPQGNFHALMLDTKGTFDRLIERYTQDPAKREAIFANKFYQQMSGTVVGSSDYMAMEKLYELHESGRYDLIVLDTPPTKHALDFLEAPSRMRKAFDRGSLDLFLKPWADAGAKSLGFLGRALGRIVTKVDNLIGLKFVEELAEFFRAFDGLYEGFQTRAARVDALLREAGTSFVVVTSPSPLPLEEATFFCEKLRDFELPLEAVILNRVQPHALGSAEARKALRQQLAETAPRALIERAEAAAQDPPALLGGMLRALMDQELLAHGDGQRIREFAQGPGRGVLTAEVPRFSVDIYDLSGLKILVDALFPAEATHDPAPR